MNFRIWRQLQGNNPKVTSVTIEGVQIVPISSPQHNNLLLEGDEFNSN